MSKAPAISGFRKFLRGLLITGLALLLPCQLGLLWLATLDGPVRLPEFATDLLTERLAAHGVQVRARAFWLRADGTLLADDLSVELDGLTGELLTAEQFELGLDGGALLAGRLAPTRLRLRNGSLWCPASVSRFGERRLLAEKIDADCSREGRWLVVPSLRARAGKLSLHLLGELPADMLTAGPRADAAAEPATRRLAFGLAKLEHGLVIAGNSGGASVNLQAHGLANGGAGIDFEILLGDDWREHGLEVVQAKDPRLQGRLSLDARGALGPWRLSAQARAVSLRGLTADAVQLNLSSATTWQAARGELAVENLAYAGLGGARVRATIAPQDRTEQGLALDFTLSTAASIAEGRAKLRTDGRAETILIRSALLSSEELRAVPAVGAAIRDAHLGLTGSVLLQGCEVRFSDQGAFASGRGRLSASGFKGLGLSAAAIWPAGDQPLHTAFDFTPTRRPYPLKLEDLRLATVTGSADCDIVAGGPYVLRLRGDIAPPALDQVLGHWWVELWKILEVGRAPYASFSVEGSWGLPKTTLVSGRVRLTDFAFMKAPFRSAEVSVDADQHHADIGLHRLAGGAKPADGMVEGTARWNFDEPVAKHDPVVKVSGDIQPWVAARCVSQELSDSLRNLVLPKGHRFDLTVLPGPKQPEVTASIRCPENFTAWNIPGRDLTVISTTREGVMTVAAAFGLAGGQAKLDIEGDPLKEAAFKLDLKGCQPKELSRVLEQAGADATPPAKTEDGKTETARIDLAFRGRLNPAAPRQLRGLGSYTLVDPELKKIRILGGISGLLEAIGVDATTYDLTRAEGTFGCLGGQAYFPDMRLSGPQSRLDLAGQVDLLKAEVNFEGDFSLQTKEGFSLKDFLNLNRTLIGLTKIRVKGPISNPQISTLRRLSDIINTNKDKDLGRIPAALME